MSAIENKLIIEVDRATSIANLVEYGRQQGFVTYDDILNFIPEAEEDSNGLENAFAALINAGIQYFENDQDLTSVETEFSQHPKTNDQEEDPGSQWDDPLSRMETNDLVGLYFNDSARHALLTAEEEVALAKRIEYGRKAREKLSHKKSRSSKQRRQLEEQIEDGWQAVEQLIRANTRLVISVAKRYTGRGVPFLDLIQEGNIGLMRASKKYEYRRGYKFSTYATWWIRQAVSRAVADHGRTIRIPVHMSDQMAKMFRVKHELTQRLGYTPSTEELATELGHSSSKVKYMLKTAQHPLSLEMPTLIGEDSSVLGDFIEDIETPQPDDTATHNILQQQLEMILEQLPAREVQILKLRFGLPDGRKHTLQEVGEKMGVTRERVRQIEKQALNRLRKPNIRSKLYGYLGN